MVFNISFVSLSFQTSVNKRGPGYWKLNTSLLTELDYVNMIKTVISDTIQEYQNDKEVDHILLWEVLKMKMRDASITYSAKRKRKRKQKFSS